MSAENVVIVESPAKAKTINKYLGRGYDVLASYGHVRDLPPKDGSVRPDEDFAMSWDVDAKSAKRLKDIAQAVKGADRLILATDPDREGEAISWHVLEVLHKRGLLKGKDVKRVVFNAITKSSVLDAMDHPRDIDDALVEAYLARRALDYLVGFTLSPVLWRKLPGARSAGRVQSVALRIVCDREAEIEAFTAQEYWSILAHLTTPDGAAIEARLTGVDGDKLDRLGIGNEADAKRLTARLDAAAFSVADVEKKPVKRNPPPPFTTSTLQQEASRKLGFSSARTMQTAQKLYEGVTIGGETQGLITYMRTDGVQMAQEAISATRDLIASRHGDRYLPTAPRVYKTKAKNAQEAHEAIRPTDMARTPDTISDALDPDQARLYELIWKRAVASQMASAELERTTIAIDARDGSGMLALRATGTVVRFDGFLSLYQEGTDDDGDDESGKRLPAVASGAALGRERVEASQHFTEPPPRYTEASLIKRLEELGIGRPSTYTSTLQTLVDRDYVRLDGKKLVPEDKGRLVTAFLMSFFARYVAFDFTADLEEKLDRISAGDIGWRDVLREFWTGFIAAVDDTKELRVSDVLEALNEELGAHIFPDTGQGDPRACPACADGRLSLKVSKFGAFIGCSNYPDCRFTRQLGKPGEGDGQAAQGPRVLGTDPETSLEVSLRDGRFGPYIQLGEAVDGEKPKRSSIPKGTDPDTVDLDLALKLLSLPREVGMHPETGKPITAGLGRYGPFVEHERVYANLDGLDDVLTVGLNRAVTLLAEKKASRRGGGTVLKELGTADGFKGPIVVKSGRYGPYATDGKTNATLPKGTEPESVTLEQAVELLAAKAGKAKGGRKTATRKAPTKKAATKKTAAAKTAKTTAD